MRCWLPMMLLVLAPGLVDAQAEDLLGRRIRAQVAGPQGPWAYGFVMQSFDDSLTMRLTDKRTAIRFRTSDVTVHRSRGYDSRRGLTRGLLIGGVTTVLLLASIPEFREDGLHQILYLLLPPVGAAVGGAIGFAAAPELWTPVSVGTAPCGGWRAVEGAPQGGPIVSTGPRDRRRGAIIGASILGGIGIVGGATDPELSPDQIPGIVLGNAAVGVFVGWLIGTRNRIVIPVGCPTS